MISNSESNPSLEKPSYEELQAELEKANKQIDFLKNTLSQKDENVGFYANISHDLRAPISAINSSVEYLLSFDLDKEEIHSVLKLIQSRSFFLQNLISDLFTLSSIQSSGKKLQLEEIEIGSFLEEYFYGCAADSKYNSRILHLQVPLEMECYVKLDTTLIVRVLDNLFTNALKYSGKGDDIWLSAEITDKKKVRVGIKDSGIGIAKENLEKIFERSYMVSQARTPSSQNGCGLGLAIAKSIIQKHGGDIWCESKENEGSVFYFELIPEKIIHE